MWHPHLRQEVEALFAALVIPPLRWRAPGELQRSRMLGWRWRQARAVAHPTTGKPYPGTKWVVLRELPEQPRRSGQARRVFECRCACGLTKPVHLANLQKGRSRMCRACAARAARATVRG